MAPTIPQDKSFADLVSVLKKYFHLKPLNCQYGTHLEESLRDCLVCGILIEHTQKRLLVIYKLTLAQAIEVAHGKEAMNKNAEALKAKEITVNAVTN